MSGIAVITEACIDTKDRACVDVCPVQCIYEFDPQKNQLFSEIQAGSGEIENSHTPAPDAIGIFADSILYVNMDECTSCTACYQPDVCPVGAIYSEEVFGRALRFNHKTVFAILSCVIFGLLLAGRWRYGWRGRRALRWTLAGFVMLLLAYVGSRFVIEVILGRSLA